MSFIGNLFDTGLGSGYHPDSTKIVDGVSAAQVNQANDQAQTGLAQQQAFLNALQGQNGIQNQNSVFNQLQGVANGQGPNPAMAALNNSTGQNIQQQAALMASQRGASANAGLMARQAAQIGGGIQQQAAGQAAALQANQSLNAMGQLGGIAGQQVANQAAATGAYNQYAQGNQSNMLNALGQQNNANVTMQSNMNNAQAGVAGVNAQAQNKAAGGILSGLAGGLGMATGGVVPPSQMQAEPMRAIPQIEQDKEKTKTAGAEKSPGDKFKESPIGKAVGVIGDLVAPGASSIGFSTGGEVPGPRSAVGRHLVQINMPTPMSSGGKVPTLLSPGEKMLSPQEAKKVAKGEESIHQTGKTVPGKAAVKGDSPKNDTVPVAQSPGNFVIPKSIMEGKDPERGAAAFVRAHMSRSQVLDKKGKK